MSLAAILVATVLLGGSTRTDHGCYALGEQAEADFVATGLAPDTSGRLTWHVRDAFGQRVEERQEVVKANVSGCWQGRFALPSDRYGCFRVYAELDGVKLPQAGTRGAGYFTYAILPDPTQRPYLAPEDAFTGLHGAAEGQNRWLGARWKLDKWPRGTDDEFAVFRQERRTSSWTNHCFITASRIFQRPGCFTEAGRAWIKANCQHPWQYECYWDLVASPEGRKHLADAFRALAHRVCHEEDFGQDLHVYEIFWEPELHYPNRAALLTAAKIAWESIRAEDPTARVAAPTQYAIGLLDDLRALFDAGLGESMNAFSIHPYGMPDEGRNLPILRETMRLVREQVGPRTPFYATEANIGATVDPVSERRQLDLLVRTLLVLKGEGFAFHHVFYGYDYGGDRADTPLGGSGIAYNVEYPKNRWNARRMSPKPSFAGIAGFTWLLDGAKPVVALDRFTDTRLGYVFADGKGVCTMALWDWGGGATETTVRTSRERTQVADVFGNVSERPSPGGKLTLTPGSTPVYLLNVDPRLWGPDGKLTRQMKGMPREVCDPVRAVAVRPTLTADVPGVAIELANDGDAVVQGDVTTRIRGVPEARQRKTVTVPAHGKTHVDVPFPGYEPALLDRPEIEVGFVSPKTRTMRKLRIGYFAADRARLGKPVTWAGGAFAAAWDARGLTLVLTAPASALTLSFAKELVEKRTDNGFADLVKSSAATLVFERQADGTVRTMRTKTQLPDRLPTGPVPADVRIEADGGSWRYRIFLAWKELGVADPRPGMSVRLALASGEAKLFDADGGVRNYGELLLK